MREKFVQISSVLCGYAVVELEGTGLAEEYAALLDAVLGAALSTAFFRLVDQVLAGHDLDERERLAHDLLASSPIFGPVVVALMELWYLGVWQQLPDTWYQQQELPLPGPADPGRTHVPSQLAYTEQLSYRSARAHPPGASPTGYGSWSLPPQ